MAAVQDGDGQQIEEEEVNTQGCHKLQQRRRSHLRLLARHLGDEDGPAQAFQGRLAGQEFIQADSGEVDDPPGGGAALDEGQPRPHLVNGKVLFV